MTRSHEQPRSEITDEAMRLAARTGQDVCDVLEEMRRASRKDRDRIREMKIVQAQKFLRCRNKQRRR